MIRFIEIGDQIYDKAHHFAWFNTCSDRFEMYDEEQVWENWYQFFNDYIHDEEYDENNYYCKERIKRYRSLYDGNRPPTDPDYKTQYLPDSEEK